MRDILKNPYSKDEERVVEWLNKKNLGGGDDPIGFLLASHSFLVEEKRDLQYKLNDIRQCLTPVTEILNRSL